MPICKFGLSYEKSKNGMAKLTFILDDGQEIVVPVDEMITIGRRDGHDVVVDDMRVSGDHAEVRRSGEDFLVRDTGSKGGTYVNEVRVDELRLHDGDKLRFGPLRAVFDAEASGSGEIEPVTTSTKRKAKATTKRAAKKISSTAKSPVKTAISRSKAAAASVVAPPVPVAPPPMPVMDLESGKAELAVLQASVSDLRTEIQALINQRTELQVGLSEEQGRLQGAKQELTAVEARLRDANRELQAKTERVAHLLADEQRLAHLEGALQSVEGKHGEWMAAINAMVAEYEMKNGEVQRLTAASEAALRELEAVTSHKKEALDHLEHLGKERELVLKERESAEARLIELRKTVAESEQRAQEVQGIVHVREDQLRTAEKKLEQMEQRRLELERHVAELSTTEQKLATAANQLKVTEEQHAELGKALEALSAKKGQHQAELDSIVRSIGEQTRSHEETQALVAQAKARLAEQEQVLLAHQAKAEASQKQLETARGEAESALAAVRAEHADELKRLEESRLKREDLDRQIKELAAVEDKLHQTRIVLQKVEGQRTETESWLRVLEEKKAFVQTGIDALAAEEGTSKGRLEVLRGREKDLRLALDELSQREQEERGRFEEIRRLSVEAEKEHAAQSESLKRSIDLTRRELGDLELKLAPLREWKDAMDKRYEKLASLPEDSAEARELWREIEAEKANLRTLISADAGQTRGITLSEAVLRGLTKGEGTREEVVAAVPEATTPKAAGKPGKLHAPASFNDGDSPSERANVGQTGTGAMLSGTGQEMALKGRLSKLRESVQREATRLEFLRQERAREEARGRTGTVAGEALMKEQERQLDTKVRREEEKLATLQRKLEMAEMEEEKRRDKITEMERKLAELKVDIAEAERDRSDARHKMEIAHAELKSLEDAAERLKKMGE